MIGCIGRALGDELHMDGEEMDAVRWISKDDLLKAIQYSSASDSSAGTGKLHLSTRQSCGRAAVSYISSNAVRCRKDGIVAMTSMENSTMLLPDGSKLRATVMTCVSAFALAGRAVQEGVLDFYIPPKWAIAHHLIETWASKHEPWFAKL